MVLIDFAPMLLMPDARFSRQSRRWSCVLIALPAEPAAKRSKRALMPAASRRSYAHYRRGAERLECQVLQLSVLL